MNDIHATILETYFFGYIDRNIGADETPPFTRTHESDLAHWLSLLQEELIAELGAAFLWNEAGILDSVRFENSAAYLASWIQKLESDPGMIVSAASQAQKASDFIMGIEHKESLQECQTSPEGMPLTWAREHGIDTGIPGFAHRDQDGDGVSTLMEWKHGTKPSDRLSRPHRQSLSLWAAIFASST